MNIFSGALKITVAFVFISSLANFSTVTAQVTATGTTVFALPAKPSDAELNQHKLGWIKTGNDFDQNKFATAELVDKEIEKRIKAYGQETPIIKFEIPINSKLISYDKYREYTDYLPTASGLNLFARRTLQDKSFCYGPLYQVKAHFWRYGDIDIAVHGDTFEDQMNVYSIARAVEIIKHRYPKAYQKLFVEPRSFQQNTLNYAQFKNRYSRTLLSFDSSPESIAAGLTINGTSVPGTDGKNEWSNDSFISIHKKSILGAESDGSKPIYKAPSAEENYVRYMREGLVETIVHESIHRYIDYMKTYDVVYNNVYQARTADNLAVASEELAVASTSLDYFRKQGGLNKEIFDYYAVVIEQNVQTIVSAGAAGRISDIYTPGNTSASLTDRVQLKVLD